MSYISLLFRLESRALVYLRASCRVLCYGSRIRKPLAACTGATIFKCRMLCLSGRGKIKHAGSRSTYIQAPSIYIYIYIRRRCRWPTHSKPRPGNWQAEHDHFRPPAQRSSSQVARAPRAARKICAPIGDACGVTLVFASHHPLVLSLGICIRICLALPDFALALGLIFAIRSLAPWENSPSCETWLCVGGCACMGKCR